MPAAKSKTLATWAALLGGPLGAHRFYLNGPKDPLGWALWLPTGVGAYGLHRALTLGQDDQLAWLLVPILGFTVAGTMLRAILYGLMPDERWQARHAGAQGLPTRWKSRARSASDRHSQARMKKGEPKLPFLLTAEADQLAAV
jgi:hypothetical protein